MDISLTSAPVQAAATQTGSATDADRAALSSDFDTFLKMLTAQVTNQDPLNPTQSQDFAAQLATFSNVEQAVKTNELLESMVSGNGPSGLAEMAGWIGMEARADGPAYFDGSPISISPIPPNGADQNFLVVRNQAGDIVQRQAISATAETMEWAGASDSGTPLPNGLYSFSLESYQDDERLPDGVVEIYSKVLEARADGDEVVLVLEGGAQLKASEVSALRQES
ncbi:flagellar hook capping FlgD N-terminal domain-containing protein [Falsihalocynthiibacter sp. SS001]|uniref:flagellar hook capping FlgD N-terminal domain-containing protein n=1 Tax=Falsihalocynthiibacter sp. SS001 TaxID=3349698 RepID=UPI0036D33BA8